MWRTNRQTNILEKHSTRTIKWGYIGGRSNLKTLVFNEDEFWIYFIDPNIIYRLENWTTCQLKRNSHARWMILLHLETGFLKGSSGCLDLGHRYENIFGIILHPCGEALNLVGLTDVTFQSVSKNHPYDVIKMRDVRQVGKETPKRYI